MRNNRLLTLIAGVSLALTMPLAHAAKTAGQTVDDSTLATTTKATLLDSHGVPGGEINVEVYKGAVQLGGFVSTPAEEQAALEAARSVQGHTQVIDALVVVPGKRSMGMTLDDTTAQTRLKAALANQMGAGAAAAINTDVRRGQALLSGWVDNQQQKDEAGRIAAATKGVTAVHNELSIKQ